MLSTCLSSSPSNTTLSPRSFQRCTPAFRPERCGTPRGSVGRQLPRYRASPGLGVTDRRQWEGLCGTAQPGMKTSIQLTLSLNQSACQPQRSEPYFEAAQTTPTGREATEKNAKKSAASWNSSDAFMWSCIEVWKRMKVP